MIIMVKSVLFYCKSPEIFKFTSLFFESLQLDLWRIASRSSEGCFTFLYKPHSCENRKKLIV